VEKMGVMNRMMGFLGLDDEEETITEEKVVDEERHEQKFNRKSNIVSLHTQKSSRIVLSEPRSYEETQHIADCLRSHRAVVINLQRIRPELARRILDFISGTIYVLDGSISKLGPNIFVCTPSNFEIEGSISELMTEEEIF
jgi:cell division inhibitor SepF